jgi:cell division protein FtsZ
MSFAIMPFKYEKERIFNSGIALKRLRADSDCTIVLDNDSLLESNPDLSPKACYDIANSAILHVVKSLNSSEISAETNILTSSKEGQEIEESLRDSLKMLYDNTSPNAVKKSILYVSGGENIPVGVINSISNLTSGVLNDSNSQVDLSSTSDESKIVMLSSVQGMTCKLDLYQLE